MPSTEETLRDALADRYRLEKQIGQGGMATVFLARDLRYDRDVALKVLRPEIAFAIGTGRFEREIRVAARLQHPHILTVLDSGEVELRFIRDWSALDTVDSFSGELRGDTLVGAYRLQGGIVKFVKEQ